MKEVNKGFGSAVKGAGLGSDVTPHVLRHTTATWLMQRGADLWQAAGFLGMTVQMLEKVYGHHRPDFQEEVAGTLDRGNRGPSGPAPGVAEVFGTQYKQVAWGASGPFSFAGNRLSTGTTTGTTSP